MVQLSLFRDESRTLQQIFEFVYAQCNSHVESALNLEEKLNPRIISSTFGEIDRQIQRKLLTQAVRFTIKLSDAEAIILYKTLGKLLVDGDNVWLVKVLNETIAKLDKQIIAIVDVYA
jgi:hypothetical protein